MISTSGITSGAHTHSVFDRPALRDQQSTARSRDKFSDVRYTVTLPNKHARALTLDFVGREHTLRSPPGSRSFSSLSESQHYQNMSSFRSNHELKSARCAPLCSAVAERLTDGSLPWPQSECPWPCCCCCLLGVLKRVREYKFSSFAESPSNSYHHEVLVHCTAKQKSG